MLAVWFKTVFSFSAYHLLRKAGPWRTVFFALYLLLVGVLVFNIYAAWQIHEKLPVFIRHFPSVTFEKGRFLSPEQATVSIPGTGYHVWLSASAKTPVPTTSEFAKKHWAAVVIANQLYMPSVTGISSQPLPAQLNGEINAQTLQTYAPSLRSLLQSVAFLGSFFILGGFLLFSYLMAWTVCFFWCAWKKRPLPFNVLNRWAVFLQGPALALWIVHLLCGVPLFVFALFILFNIYIQQIFNTLPDA